MQATPPQGRAPAGAGRLSRAGAPPRPGHGRAAARRRRCATRVLQRALMFAAAHRAGRDARAPVAATRTSTSASSTRSSSPRSCRPTPSSTRTSAHGSASPRADRRAACWPAPRWPPARRARPARRRRRPGPASRPRTSAGPRAARARMGPPARLPAAAPAVGGDASTRRCSRSSASASRSASTTGRR